MTSALPGRRSPGGKTALADPKGHEIERAGGALPLGEPSHPNLMSLLATTQTRG